MAKKKDGAPRAPTVTAAELKLQEELARVKESDKARAKAIRAELKRLAFLRLAPKRVRKALQALGNVEALGGYPVELGEVEKILGALRKALEKVEQSFARTAEDGGASFEL